MHREKLFLRPLKLLERRIEGIAETLEADTYSKKLKLGKHIELMVAQGMEGCTSLRDISALSRSSKCLTQISASQLCEVNRNRDYRAYVGAFFGLVGLAVRRYHLVREVKNELEVLGIDSSFIKLKAHFSEYGYNPLTRGIEEGIKMHMGALLGSLTIPLSVIVTPGNVADSPALELLLEDMGSFADLSKVILVFDRGYCSLQRFKELTEEGIRYVTRLKSNYRYEVLAEKRRSGYMDQTITMSNGLVQRLVVEEKDGHTYLTNIFDLPPELISLAFGERWDLEVLFKTLKSGLKIDHFLGKNLNSVLIQLFCALIGYLLILIFQLTHAPCPYLSLSEIRRALRYGDEVLPIPIFG